MDPTVFIVEYMTFGICILKIINDIPIYTAITHGFNNTFFISLTLTLPVKIITPYVHVNIAKNILKIDVYIIPSCP